MEEARLELSESQAIVQALEPTLGDTTVHHEHPKLSASPNSMSHKLRVQIREQMAHIW